MIIVWLAWLPRPNPPIIERQRGWVWAASLPPAMDDRFEKILEERPTHKELSEHIRISNWYQLGIQLDIDHDSLDDIDNLSGDYIHKTTKMFARWLDSNSHATRRQVIDALKKEAVKRIAIAHDYEETLKMFCSSSGK